MQQVVLHGRNRVRHQIAAVVHRHDLHPLGKDRGVQAFDLLMDAVEDKRRILAPPHQDQPLDLLALAVVCDRTPARGRHHLNGGDVADSQRSAVLGFERDALDVLGRLDQADAAHGQLLIALPQEAAADIRIRFADRVLEFAQGQSGGIELAGIGLDVQLFQKTAERDHVGDALNLAQHPGHGPLHLRPSRKQVMPVASHPEAIDFAQRGRFRTQHRRDSGGQLGVADPLRYDHAAGERVRLVVKDQGDDRQAKQVLASQHGHARGAVQRPLQRDRNLPLDLGRRIARHLGDDLDLGVGDVGKGFDRQPAIGLDPEDG